MTAESLTNWIENDSMSWHSLTSSVKTLRNMVDRVATKATKANAEWHDDPSADDHAAHHAPADVQFPREVRDQAIMQLVKFYLGELSIQENNK